MTSNKQCADILAILLHNYYIDLWQYIRNYTMKSDASASVIIHVFRNKTIRRESVYSYLIDYNFINKILSHLISPHRVADS